MKRFNHILVPTDFSETARDALQMARRIAEGTQSRLSVLHVIADVWRQSWVAEAGVELAAIQREWEEDAGNRLKALVAEHGLANANVDTVVLIGTPHAAIAEYAETQRVDLIVLGTHGHGPVRRFLLGGVAERLIRTARCPVLAVPPESLRVMEAVTYEPAAAVVGAGAAPDRAADEQC